MSADHRGMSPLERLIAEAVGGNQQLGDDDDPVRLNCPELWRWLTCTDAGPGHVKDPAKLTITCVPGGVLVSLIDASLAVSMDVSCRTLAEVFEAVQRTLKAPNPPLRVWAGKKPTVRKRPAGP